MPVGASSIRLLQASDLPALQRIYAQAVLDGGATADLIPPPAERWDAFLRLHRQLGWPCWVVVPEGTVCAYGFLSPWRQGREGLAGVVEISYYVERGYRRRGIARRIVEHALEEALRLQYHSMMAILLADNEASVQLLESLGFEEWGRLPKVFRRPGENGLQKGWENRSDPEHKDQCIMGRRL